MPATPSLADGAEEIATRLTAVADRGYTRQRVFEDWLDAMLFSFQGRDDPYLEIVERYDPEVAGTTPGDGGATWDTAIDQFATATGDLITASRATETDVLGDVYTAFGQRSEAFGQFFTPHHVARFIADIQVATAATAGEQSHADAPAEPPDDPMSIADPACGSGRLLIACRPHAPAGVYVGQDKDPLCAKMTAVNLVLFGLSGYAIHGDSLTIDQYRAWEIVNPPYGPLRCIELDPDDDPVPLSEDHWDTMTDVAADDSTAATAADATTPSPPVESDPESAIATAATTAPDPTAAQSTPDAASDASTATADDRTSPDSAEQVTLADLADLTESEE